MTPTRVSIAVSAIWITAFSTALLQTLTTFNDMVNSSGEVLVILLASFAYIKIYKIARHHQNQIHGQTQLENQNNQMTQLARAMKLGINTLYIYVVLLMCYAPSLFISPIFMMSDTPGPVLTLFYIMGASLVFLNSSFNPLVYCWKIREVRERAADILKRLFSRCIPGNHS